MIVVNRPGAQCLWASAPERWHFVDLVEHAVQPLENENEGGPHGFRRPVSDGQHLHDVAPEPSALHGQGVVGGELQQGVGDLRQPAKPTAAATSPTLLSGRSLRPRRVTRNHGGASSPHVRLDVQQLKGRDARLTGHVLQDFEPRSAVLVEFRADVQEGFAGPAKLFPGVALVYLFLRHTLALFQQVEVVPARRRIELIRAGRSGRHSHVFLHVRPGVDPSGHGVVRCGASLMALITAGHLGCCHRPADDGTKTVKQGWAVILPAGPHWVLDLDEWAEQVVLENNPQLRIGG